MKKTIVVLLALFCAGVASADTVRLKNGYVLHGKVIRSGQDPNILVPAGKVRLQFKNGGWMLLKEKEIETFQQDDTDQFEMREKD